MNLGLIAEAHCSAGIMTHRAHGHLLPKFWVQGDERRAVAEPATREGLEISTAKGIVMFGLMVDMTEARCFGRTVEAWVRTFCDGDQFPAAGLASIAETDPEVHTAIVSQGFDLITGETYTAIARFSLDADGHAIWQRQADTNPGDQFATLALAVKQYVNARRPSHSAAEIDEFVADCGWAVRVTDA